MPDVIGKGVARKRSRKLKSIRPAPAPTNSPQVDRAQLILKYAHDSAAASLRAFDIVRRQRRAGGGTTTDEEQDLLRAMLVFAAAGLDAMLKQVIRDSLPDLALVDLSHPLI